MTNEQKVIAANAAYIGELLKEIEELLRDITRLEKSRDYAQDQYNKECNKLIASEKELQAANVENLDLEFELEYTQKQLKAAKESSEGLTQDLIESEKNIAELREQLEKMTGERDEADKLVTYLRTGKDEFRKECDRLTDSNKALKLALELKQLNGPDVAELRKEIRQLQDQNDELTRMCAPDPDIPPVHVKTAEEIAEWCDSVACAVCNHMQIDDEGNRECDLEIYGDEPCNWSIHVIKTLNKVIKFSTEQESANVIVADEEDDE